MGTNESVALRRLEIEKLLISSLFRTALSLARWIFSIASKNAAHPAHCPDDDDRQ